MPAERTMLRARPSEGVELGKPDIHVLRMGVTYSGTVRGERHERGGDWHLYVIPAPASAATFYPCGAVNDLNVRTGRSFSDPLKS